MPPSTTPSTLAAIYSLPPNIANAVMKRFVDGMPL